MKEINNSLHGFKERNIIKINGINTDKIERKKLTIF